MSVHEQLAEQILGKVFLHPGANELAKTEIVSVLHGYNIERITKGRKGNAGRYVQRFLNAKQVEGLSAKTLDNYKRYLSEFAGVVNKDINRINADDIRAYIAKKEVRDTSKQTILCTLRSFFNWLTKEEIIRKNPMLKIPSVKIANKRVRKAMSQEVWEKYRLSAKTIREKALIEFFYSTGCRVSEVTAINTHDVDFETRSVKVIGKGNKERVVYFSHRAKLLLQKYLQGRKDSCLALFANVRGGGRMSVRSIQKLIRAIGVRAALLERIHPHLLRHTFATHNYNKGMQITTIQRILGHEQLSTTQIYAELSERNIIYEYDQIVA